MGVRPTQERIGAVGGNEIRERQNRRPEFRPYVSVRRFDQRYRVTVRLEGLEHTHKQGFADRSVAWDLVERVRLHLERGHDLKPRELGDRGRGLHAR